MRRQRTEVPFDIETIHVVSGRPGAEFVNHKIVFASFSRAVCDSECGIFPESDLTENPQAAAGEKSIGGASNVGFASCHSTFDTSTYINIERKGSQSIARRKADDNRMKKRGEANSGRNTFRFGSLGDSYKA